METKTKAPKHLGVTVYYLSRENEYTVVIDDSVYLIAAMDWLWGHPLKVTAIGRYGRQVGAAAMLPSARAWGKKVAITDVEENVFNEITHLLKRQHHRVGLGLVDQTEEVAS